MHSAFRAKVGYMQITPPNSTPQRTKIPALETTGIGVARAGTAVWFVVMVGSWLSQETLKNTAFFELPQISTAGFLLGLIGIRHVDRKSTRLNSSHT